MRGTCSRPTDGLFERVNERIKKQIETVEELTGVMDPKTNFALIVIQTELERYKYLVRSYLRARIAKVRPSAAAAAAALCLLSSLLARCSVFDPNTVQS
ncbi:MAG: hypothetical protein OK454_04425 [Thaumarchaeota archaeon]|nr:hypothetical protein [Nitrososphaerota archaeon]